MTLADEIVAKSRQLFTTQWTVRDGMQVPDATTVKQGNDAVHFSRPTILYADLDSSTSMVDKRSWQFSAQVYKSFLYAAARVIRNAGGVITSYDGDRVMAVFIGDTQTSSAAKSALQINYATKNYVQPEIDKRHPNLHFKLRHVVGIDTSEVWAANAGARGDNDLTWVGRAANYAAKLTALNADYPTWITDQAFQKLTKETKYGGHQNQLMWQKWQWSQMNNIPVHSSNWTWRV